MVGRLLMDISLRELPVYTIINGDIKMKDGKIIGEPSGKPIKFED